MTRYHNPLTCNACGCNENALERLIGEFDGFPYAYEIETYCPKCAHKDYWAHGYFESSQDGLDACSKYSLEPEGLKLYDADNWGE